MGCHGCEGDNIAANPDFGTFGGRGAGLRQHHYGAGVALCAGCHQDANPANYTPVGEDVLPDYYANPGTNHPNFPVDSCNPGGTEDFAGVTEGLDNDGDGVYDGAIDLGETCDPPGTCPTSCDDAFSAGGPLRGSFRWALSGRDSSTRRSATPAPRSE